MAVVFEQTLSLFLFAFAGYLLVKLKLVKSEHTGLLSSLLVYVFSPCLVFNTFSENCTRSVIGEKMPYITSAIVILAVLIVIASVVTRIFWHEPYLRHVYHYSLVVPCYGYMGYALVQSLYGDMALLNAMIFCLPINLYTFSVAYPQLTGSGKISFRMLLNPNNLCILLGCAVGLSGLRLPSVLTTVLTKSGACMAPVSMVLTGIVLSEFKLSRLIRSRSSIVITFCRLIVIPLIVILSVKRFFDPEIALIAGLIFAMPCGLNTIVFPRLVGKDCEPGASLAFLSNVFALITVPVMLTLFF